MKIRHNIINSMRDFGKKALLPAMIVASGVNASAQTLRTASIDVDPAFIGYAGETVDLTEFQVEWYSTPDPDVFGYVVNNRVHPQYYLETRGTVMITPGTDGFVDGIATLPADPITDANQLGGLAPNAEVPGSNPGRDLDVEVGSSLHTGYDATFLTQTGVKEFYYDLDGDSYPGLQQRLQTTIDRWNVGHTRAIKNTFRSSQGNPTGWTPGQYKVWKVIPLITNAYLGQIDTDNATIRISRGGAIQPTFDEEIFSAMFVTWASPFANQNLPVIPETYKRLFDNQNFSEILDNGTKVPLFVFGGGGYNRQIYVHGADDGTGNFPESITTSNLVQRDNLDQYGAAISTITVPPTDTINKSLGTIKALYR